MAMQTMTKTLRQALRESELTVYAVAKATGMQTDSLYRFLEERSSLRLDLADRLAQFFGLELRKAASKAASKGSGRKGQGNGKHRK